MKIRTYPYGGAVTVELRISTRRRLLGRDGVFLRPEERRVECPTPALGSEGGTGEQRGHGGAEKGKGRLSSLDQSRLQANGDGQVQGMHEVHPNPKESD